MTIFQPSHNRLIDAYHRRLNYLRISITDRCNLRCLYCSPPDAIYSQRDILTYEELLRLIRIGVRLGVTKIRITGGEPFVRRGVGDFLKEVCSIQGLSDVSLTTNGVLLLDHLKVIQSAGIRRINISLDTLDPEKFYRITRKDAFYQVWDGLIAAHRMGFFPIKINVVALRGINDEELIDLANLSFEYPFHIRFIEYMPIGPEISQSVSPLLADDIMNRLASVQPLIPINRELQDGPAERYRFEGAKGEIGFIRPISHHFCSECNRLRLTAAGKLRLCLLSDQEVDLKKAIRSGYSDDDLAAILIESIKLKPQRHTLDSSHPFRTKTQMNAIGG